MVKERGYNIPFEIFLRRLLLDSNTTMKNDDQECENSYLLRFHPSYVDSPLRFNSVCHSSRKTFTDSQDRLNGGHSQVEREFQRVTSIDSQFICRRGICAQTIPGLAFASG